MHVNESHVVDVCGVGNDAPSGGASLGDRWVMKFVDRFYIEKTLKNEKRTQFST